MWYSGQGFNKVKILPSRFLIGILYCAIDITRRPFKIKSGVDFINGFAPLRPTFEKLFTGAKVRRKAQKFVAGHKTVYEIDPWTIKCPVIK